MLKLNIGCGTNKLEGYINIDTEESCEPDLLHNILDAPLPYEQGAVEEIVFFHCIEHVRKIYHRQILLEFNRVLRVGGQLYISYPDFWKCAQRWKNNEGGQRKFWEATLYGRQLYDSDYHVCAMSHDELADNLISCGFGRVLTTPEPQETYNNITYAEKRVSPVANDYERLVGADISRMSVQQV